MSVMKYTRGWTYGPSGCRYAHSYQSLYSGLRMHQESSFVFDTLRRPLRPIWITPASHIPTLTNPAYYPVVCVCASRMVEHGLERRMATFFTYVQGAGDDHEMWCRVSHLKFVLFISNSFPEGPDTEHVLGASRSTIIQRSRESLYNDRTDYPKRFVRSENPD